MVVNSKYASIEWKENRERTNAAYENGNSVFCLSPSMARHCKIHRPNHWHGEYCRIFPYRISGWQLKLSDACLSMSIALCVRFVRNGLRSTHLVFSVSSKGRWLPTTNMAMKTTMYRTHTEVHIVSMFNNNLQWICNLFNNKIIYANARHRQPATGRSCRWIHLSIGRPTCGSCTVLWRKMDAHSIGIEHWERWQHLPTIGQYAPLLQN